MSIFSNPISRAEGEAKEYTQAILELLGDRDPLEVLDELPGRVRDLVQAMTDEQLRTAEAPGKWSMLEVVQHLADSELVWAYRLRVVLADADPVLTGYDQDRWADELRYNQADPVAAVEQLTTLRGLNLKLLRALGSEEMKRSGRHSERGEESIEHMLQLYAGHDLVHLRQLSRIRDGLGERG